MTVASDTVGVMGAKRNGDTQTYQRGQLLLGACIPAVWSMGPVWLHLHVFQENLEMHIFL